MPRKLTYTNPVYAHNFPDPFILRVGRTYYAYATESGAMGIQVVQSTDLVHWSHHAVALTVPWSKVNYWAPEVVVRGSGYYMTYSCRNSANNKHEIGIATSSSPHGPFKHAAMLVHAGSNRVGVIDASIFTAADGTSYLVYSEEEPRRIVMRKMAPDLLSVESSVKELVRPDRPWEHGVTEAPTLIMRHGIYYLFFSVGWFQSNKKDANYAVCYATAHSLNGPYEKATQPLLQTVPGVVYGPGHQSVFELPSGEWWMVYHGWNAEGEPRNGSNPVGRSMRIDRLLWVDDVPVVNGPTSTPQVRPDVRAHDESLSADG